MKDDGLFVIHVLECIQRIREYTLEGKEGFLKDTKTQDAVLRNLHTLAESTQRITATLRDKYSRVEWEKISAFRNVVVHDYLGIDANTIWDIVQNDLPSLEKQMKTISTDLGLSDTRN